MPLFDKSHDRVLSLFSCGLDSQLPRYLKRGKALVPPRDADALASLRIAFCEFQRVTWIISNSLLKCDSLSMRS